MKQILQPLLGCICGWRKDSGRAAAEGGRRRSSAALNSEHRRRMRREIRLKNHPGIHHHHHHRQSHHFPVDKRKSMRAPRQKESIVVVEAAAAAAAAAMGGDMVDGGPKSSASAASTVITTALAMDSGDACSLSQLSGTDIEEPFGDDGVDQIGRAMNGMIVDDGTIMSTANHTDTTSPGSSPPLSPPTSKTSKGRKFSLIHWVSKKWSSTSGSSSSRQGSYSRSINHRQDNNNTLELKTVIHHHNSSQHHHHQRSPSPNHVVLRRTKPAEVVVYASQGDKASQWSLNSPIHNDHLTSSRTISHAIVAKTATVTSNGSLQSGLSSDDHNSNQKTPHHHPPSSSNGPTHEIMELNKKPLKGILKKTNQHSIIIKQEASL